MSLGTLVWKKWEAYWFAKASAVGLAVFRIVFGILIFLYHVPRLFYLKELYTSEGFLYPFNLFQIFHLPILSYEGVILLHAVFFIALGCLIVGYRTRAAAIIVFILNFYLLSLERFSTQSYGRVLIIYTLLLALSPSGSFLSVDSKRSGVLAGKPPLISIVWQRLMLWQFASIFLFNFLSKMRFSDGWLSGQYIHNIFSDTEQFARPYSSHALSQIDFLYPYLGTAILAGILLAGIGLLFSRSRPYAIFAAAAYMTGVLFTLEINYIFPLLIYALCLASIDPWVWERWWMRFESSPFQAKNLISRS